MSKKCYLLPQSGICLSLFKGITRGIESNQAIAYWPAETSKECNKSVNFLEGSEIKTPRLKPQHGR
jgi:hypothetical protein